MDIHGDSATRGRAAFPCFSHTMARHVLVFAWTREGATPSHSDRSRPVWPMALAHK